MQAADQLLLSDNKFCHRLRECIRFPEDHALTALVTQIQILAVADSTLRSYMSVSQRFVVFCRGNHVDVPNLSCDDISLFLVDLARSQLKVSTISTMYSNLRGFFKLVHAEFPTESKDIELTLRGLGRVCDTSIKRAIPILGGHLSRLEAVLSGVPHGSPLLSILRPLLSINNLRLITMLTVAHDGLLRVSELLSLRWCHVNKTVLGYVLTIVHSKANQIGPAEQVSIVHHTTEYTSAATWMDLFWLKSKQSNLDFVFHNNNALKSPITAREVNDWIKSNANNLELNADSISSHSLRAGGATDMVLRGATPNDVMRQGRWKSASMVDIYFRPSLSTWQEHLQRQINTTGGIQGVPRLDKCAHSSIDVKRKRKR